MDTFKHTHRDWSTHNTTITSLSSTFRGQSKQVRDDTATLTRDAAIDLQQTQRNVHSALTQRIDEIEQRRQDLQKEIAAVFAEIGHLSVHKDTLEKELRDKEFPVAITRECQELRTQRKGTELVADDVDTQLEKEMTLLNTIRAALKKKIEESTEQLRLLRAAQQQLEADAQDKNTAFEIDNFSASLSPTHRGAPTFSPSATRVDPKSSNPAQWMGFTDSNIQLARKHRARSEALRSEIDALIKNSADRMANQANACETSFNTRLAELNDGLRDNQQHLAKTNLEIKELEGQIADLEASIAARKGPLQLAHTRLDQRSKRPNVELVHDIAQLSLMSEVEQIEAQLAALNRQLQDATQSLKALNRARLTLEEDIQLKTISVNLDNKCMLRRQQFKYRML